MPTTRTFDEFFDTLVDSYAIEIDDTVMLPVFEEEMDETLGDTLVLYDEWNGNITIPLDRNKDVEFDEIARSFEVKGFTERSDRELIETFRIRFLKLM